MYKILYILGRICIKFYTKGRICIKFYTKRVKGSAGGGAFPLLASRSLASAMALASAPAAGRARALPSRARRRLRTRVVRARSAPPSGSDLGGARDLRLDGARASDDDDPGGARPAPAASPPRAPVVVSRRASLRGSAAALACSAPLLASLGGAALSAPPAARATLELTYDGVGATAFAFDVPLRVLALRGTAPSQWETEFNRVLQGKGKLALTNAIKPGDVYEELKRAVEATNDGAGQRGGPWTLPPPGGSAATPTKNTQPSSAKDKDRTKNNRVLRADVIALGDEFLAPAIRAGLLAPLPADLGTDADWFRRTPPRFRAMVARDARTGDTAGGANNTNAAVYGVPYRWQCALIAYRKDKLPSSLRDTPPKDWSDLFRPEFKGRVAFPGGARFALTACLKAEGYSMNPPKGGFGNGADGPIPASVRDRLDQLRFSQLLTQSDEQYAQALAVGDAWLAIGPSDEMLALARKSSLIRVVVPESGTQLYADVWAIPASARGKKGGVSPLVGQWFDFTTQPARANVRVGLRGGVAPVAFNGADGGIDYARNGGGPTSGFVRYDVSDARREREQGWVGRAFPGLRFGGGGSEDDDSDSSGVGGEIMRGGMPRDEVWARSEFAEPLDDATRNAYNEIIAEWGRRRKK